MAKLEVETRKAINEFFDIKINKMRKELEKIEEKEIKEYEEKFEKDKDVIKARELLKKISNKYKARYKHCECYLGSIYYDYLEESKIHEEICNKMAELRSQKRKILITLENESKNSKVYKECLENFLKESENND